jgi:hypothetical protein
LGDVGSPRQAGMRHEGGCVQAMSMRQIDGFHRESRVCHNRSIGTSCGTAIVGTGCRAGFDRGPGGRQLPSPAGLESRRRSPGRQAASPIPKVLDVR